MIFYSSVITSGHCVCGAQVGRLVRGKKGLKFIEPQDPCLPNTENQITVDNKISIVSGDNRRRKYINLGFLKKTISAGVTNEIVEAKIKYIELWVLKLEEMQKGDSFDYKDKMYDVAVLKSKKNIYKDGDTTKAPICLGALNAKMDVDQKITTVGWGYTYYEYPERHPELDIKVGPTVVKQKRNPIATTCSTNKYGPFVSRFKNCDIQFLKDNQWACKKIKNIEKRRPKVTELPNVSSIPSYNFDACEKYFSEAEILVANVYEKSSINWTNHLGDVKNILVYNYEEELNNVLVKKVLQCYRKELFETHGWCKVAIEGSQRSHDDWGFCDTSCEGASVNKRYCFKSFSILYFIIYIYIYIYMYLYIHIYI